MSLNLYRRPDYRYPITEDNPFRVTFDGKVGGMIDQQVFIRNDDLSRWYSNIALVPVDTVNGTNSNNIVTEARQNFFWKLAIKDVPLTNEEWNLISPGNSVTIPYNIGAAVLGDISTYAPVWVRVSIQRDQLVDVLTNVVLRISATEGLVTG